MVERGLLVLALVLLSGAPGCSWYFLERDPAELALRAPAPAFSLRTAAGPAVSLADLREQGNPLLVFYRGHW